MSLYKEVVSLENNMRGFTHLHTFFMLHMGRFCVFVHVDETGFSDSMLFSIFCDKVWQ